MSLMPVDVAKHEFNRAFRGYDPVEVRSFLEWISEEITDLHSQIAHLTEQNHLYAAKLSSYQEMEKNLRDSLLSAQQNQRDMHEQSLQDRQRIIREAELIAEEKRLSAQSEVAIIHERIRALKTQHDAFVQRLRYLLKAQQDLLDSMEKETSEIAHDRSEAATE